STPTRSGTDGRFGRSRRQRAAPITSTATTAPSYAARTAPRGGPPRERPQPSHPREDLVRVAAHDQLEPIVGNLATPHLALGRGHLVAGAERVIDEDGLVILVLLHAAVAHLVANGARLFE